MRDAPELIPGDLVAVGDIHGSSPLLRGLVSLLEGSGVHLLFLGDLIDRARKPRGDVEVLETVRDLMLNPGKYGISSANCLRGNHEQMFIDAAYGGPEEFRLWVMNGGNAQAMDEMEEHLEWLTKLPLYHLVDSTLYVHAGVRPGIPLEDQNDEDLVWIRNPFLSSRSLSVEGVDLVVHGHTPNFDGEIVEKPGVRVCLDSGSFKTGVISARVHRTGETFQVSLPEHLLQ